jgi:signal transduction histidine kinase
MDRTPRERSDGSSKEQSTLDRDLIEGIGVVAFGALVAIDGAGKPVWHNAQFAEIFGDPAAAFGAGGTIAGLAWLANAGGSQHGAGDLILPDGRSIEWRARPLGIGGTSGVVLALSDTTTQRKTERSAAEARSRLRLLSAHTWGILFEFDSEARFVRVWASDPSLLARPEHELLGRTLIEALGPELGSLHDQKVRSVLRTGVGEEYEYMLDVPRGRRVFAASNAAVPSADGTGRSAIFWIRDVTDQVEMRTKLLQAERLASVGMLAAGVAHEINNPLGYMMLNLDHLRSALQSLGRDFPNLALEGLASSVEMVSQGAERVRKIVGDLRIFSRADDAPGPVELQSALELAVDMTRPQVESRAIIVKEFGEAPVVMANPGRLSQVFVNLIVNAAQAIAPGDTERNEIRLVTRTDERGRAVVEVHDTGIGIARDLRDRIFDPFFTTKENGTGLGLSICHRIIGSLGGEIRLVSGEPRGTVFRVLLPPAAPVE